MSAKQDYLSALVFTNVDWVLNEFDITRDKAKLLVSDLKILRNLDFIVQIRRKVQKLQDSQSSYQISEKVGLPLSIVNQIISESRSLKQEEVQNSKQKDSKMLELRNNNSIQSNDQNPNYQRQQTINEAQKIQEDILYCYEEFLKVEEKQESTYSNKKRPRKEIKKKIIILPEEIKLNDFSNKDPQNQQKSIQNISQTQNQEIDLYSKTLSFEQNQIENQENQQSQSQLQNKEIIRLTKSGMVYRESEDKQ